MTKQGNFTQRTPQAKKQSDQASRQISKQASGSANTPHDLVFTAMGPSLGTTQTTATITSTEGLQRATFTTPPQTVPGTNTTEPPPPPLRNKGPEDSVQTPVYFVSKALKETEINYSAMEKLILALVFAAKRLRRYFQAHPIVVITDQPIKQVISKPDASGRLQKWSVLLGEHNISYRPRTAVKGQILADFLIEKPETDAVLPQSE
ncbi:reverse transcriptase domain-containing protein, partial [Tanacetum coccineum]